MHLLTQARFARIPAMQSKNLQIPILYQFKGDEMVRCEQIAEEAM